MLRLALIKNLRRVAVMLSRMRKDRDRADDWADRILKVAETEPSGLIVVVTEMAQTGQLLYFVKMASSRFIFRSGIQ
jgi:cyclic beta-1,2-glucan synthetase